MELVVTSRYAKPGEPRMTVVNRAVAGIEGYRKAGGYETAKKVLTSWTPEQVIEETKKSKLRGRGGAGFPTGMKWSFVPKDGQEHYLVVNADESEPGTFKDRYLIEHDPHGLIEGCIIAAHAIQAHRCYIYIRGEYFFVMDHMKRAIDEAYKAGVLGDKVLGTDFKLDVIPYSGAGAYICGEETGLLNSLEGKRGEPRLKPPFPAVKGLYGKPTCVNNVETLHNLPFIIEKGAEWFAKMGSEKSGGTRMLCVSGRVKHPGVFELPLNYNLKTVLDKLCGGPSRGLPIKAVFPGGSSSPVLRYEECDAALCFDAIAAKGSMGGSGGVIVLDEGDCMVESMANVAHFYAHESCGQCSPCREGTHAIHLLIEKIEAGTARMADIDTLYDLSGHMMGTTICALSDAAAMPMRSFIEKFRDEFEAHVRAKGCPHKARKAELAGPWSRRLAAASAPATA